MAVIHLSPTAAVVLATLGVVAIAFVSGYAAGYLRRSLISWRRRRHAGVRDREHPRPRRLI